MQRSPSGSQKRVGIEKRLAAKPHACRYCSKEIEPGQDYVRLAVVKRDGTPDGEFVVVKFHAENEDCGTRSR